MQGIIPECNGRIPHEMVKGTVKCVNTKSVKNVPIEMKKHKKCCIKSCNAFVHTICKSKMFYFKHANQEHMNRCIKCSKKYAQIGGGFMERLFWRQTESEGGIKMCSL